MLQHTICEYLFKMELSEETLIFWSILEKDLELRVPEHIKNIMKYVANIFI